MNDDCIAVRSLLNSPISTKRVESAAALTSAMYSRMTWRGSWYFERLKTVNRKMPQECYTLGTAGIDMSSVSGSQSSSLGSALGSAAALSLDRKNRRLRATRNPRINIH
jgi:hypothetical protein